MDAGPGVPPQIRSKLIGEMVGSPTASLAGAISGLLVNSVAIALHGGHAFVVFLLTEAALLAGRLTLLRRAARNTRRGVATPPDLHLMLICAWCALQGAVAFTSLASGIRALQILAATSFMALIGPICGRNYGAPRYAMLLLALVFLPLVAGAQMCGEPWLLVMLPQAPLLFIGAHAILRRYRTLAISSLMAREDSLYRAHHDSLTGLLNRAGLAENLRRFDASRQPYGVFYLDLDGFKPVNDTHGHETGDRLLAAVADRLQSCTRKGDLVARVGGDEFIVVAPTVPPSEAPTMAERLVRQVTEAAYPLAGIGPVRIGVSVGFACAPEDGIRHDELYRKADAALYDAKRAGKGMHRRFTAAAVPVGALIRGA
jgi:diguanylate cyclase (GGDEF)-like protein